MAKSAHHYRLASLKRKAKFAIPLIGVAIAFVEFISTLIGDLYAWGTAGAIAIFGVAASIVGVGVARHGSSSISGALELRGYAGDEPAWLRDDVSGLGADLRQVVRASVVLLVVDRGDSGFWGNTYLYRRAVSKSGLPECGGSLTGSPLTIASLASCLEGDLSAFVDWVYRPISRTISENLAPDGNYILDYRPGTAIDRVPVFEPLRHAAGGLLTTLMLDTPNLRDIETLKLLIASKHETIGWTMGVVSRCLLQASYSGDIPRRLRRAARKRGIELFGDLVTSGESTVSSRFIWADPYSYGTQVKNQWMTLLAVLPLGRVEDVPASLRSRFEMLVRRFLDGQLGSAPTGGLMPLSVDEHGHGSGEHVFGSAVAVAALRSLAVFRPSVSLNDDVSTKAVLERLLANPSKLIEGPACHPDGKPTLLEGYFAWAALCVAGGSVGVRLQADEFRRCTRHAEELLALMRDPATSEADLLAEVTRSTLFDREVGASVAAAASRLRTYAQIVDEARRLD